MTFDIVKGQVYQTVCANMSLNLFEDTSGYKKFNLQMYTKLDTQSLLRFIFFAFETENGVVVSFQMSFTLSS